MSYRLAFKESALKEWRKLGETVREQFKAKLKERLEHPHVPAAKLRGAGSRYKIKLRASGYRLVYEVSEEALVLTVVAVGKRDGGDVYGKATRR
ncbi:MAG: addiction module toxin RelE [Rhodospirillales bacterium 69-11]|nr:type II toxin-antitoxin system RelE/ParE family toxin [Rhodospirillales bacterium]MBN8909003.1 type II toxin-antitoxin system RelE/ParE family toxin [Rhodospirillales bacterium]MBN8926784.1 type II toxin-antitoxin system RelE/ParE family toxin [Rhodospirillales bacterium]OJW26791.1 MAG: addiction module toxin RelE [Rhodospirillales bacterium 69-11]